LVKARTPRPAARQQLAGDDFGRAVVVGHVEGVEAGRRVVGHRRRALHGVEQRAATLHVGHLPQAGDDARDLQARREQRAFGARGGSGHLGSFA
jgi:hypothetical protein